MRHPILTALLTLALLPGAEPTPAADQPAQTPPAEEQESPLATAMGDLKRALRPIKRATDTDTLPENAVELVAQARAAAVTCRAHAPAKVTAATGEAQAEALAEYHRQMDAVIATLDELAAAVTVKNVEQAATLLGTLKTQEQAGHERFQDE